VVEYAREKGHVVWWASSTPLENGSLARAHDLDLLLNSLGTREWPTLLLGASPRAALCMMLVAQTSAAFDGRDYLVPDDVKRAVQPVLRHRVMLKPEAELEGFDADRVLADVTAAVPVPRQ
jgi:MoxR-like ATPase